MSFVYSRSALWNIFSSTNGIPRLESTTWNNLKVAGIARLATRRGCRAGASKQRPIPTIQGYSRYSGPTFDNSQFQFRHLSFQNDYYSPFMQISSNLFDRDFHNNMLINLSTSSATQAHNSSTPDRQIPRHSSGSISTCSFGLINCRSVCNKTLVVKDLVVDKDIDILGITETWLHGNDLDNHVTPVLIKLHWLPVRFRIMFKILLMVYKCLHDMAPPYLANVIKPRKTPRSLISTTMEYLEEQRSRLVTYGDRSFSVAGPKLWNNLPLQIRKSSSIQSFKKELKSHLFKSFVSFGFK